MYFDVISQKIMLKGAREEAITRGRGEEEEILFIPRSLRFAERDNKHLFLKMKNGKGNKDVL